MHNLTTETLRTQKHVGSTRQLQEKLILREKHYNASIVVQDEPVKQEKQIWFMSLGRLLTRNQAA